MENQDTHTTSQPPKDTEWERDVLEKLAFSAVTEQRRTRRWNNFFKSLMFIYLLGIFAMAMYPKFKDGISGGDKPHAAVIDISGVIAESEDANADSIIEGLRAAAKDTNTKGIILKINSPGGSPVQSAYIYDEIRRIKAKQPDLPIYSVVGDICASGGYYIAAATDKIFVSQASIIGSIGVIMNGFGFVDVLEKLGVERRLLTAGSHKAMLDPFSPAKEEETQHMQILLDEVHQQFIDAVKAGRGDRLKESDDMFSGLVWTGAEGVKLGLADGFGNVDSIARDVLETEQKVNFTPQERLLDKLAGSLGASFGQAFSSAINNVSLR
ncbi:MAG: signal peptide peptidase SppA [Methylococcaceae bacterium]|nr:signal peptide peptidase SppA [Methylococcaceae bacterium]